MRQFISIEINRELNEKEVNYLNRLSTDEFMQLEEQQKKDIFELFEQELPEPCNFNFKVIIDYQ